MKNYTLTLAAACALVLASCGGGHNPTTIEGKRERLEELLKEQARISVEIAELEQAVATAGAKAADSASASEKARPVTVSTVQAGPFKHYVEVQGQVESENVVLVNGKMPSLLEEIYVKEGDRVTKGQVLARIDNAVIRSQIATLQTQLDVAENLYNRQKALWDQKIGSEVQFINAKAQRDGLLRQMATLKENLAMTNVTAPISGTVDKVNARVGESAINPRGEGIFRIVNLSDLKVSGNVSETYLPYLRKGAPVEVVFPELNETVQGTLSFVASVVDQTSRTLHVEARVRNNSKLRPNMIAKLRINDQTLPNAVAIDQNLVQTSEQGSVVRVARVEGSKAVVESRKVQTGLSYNGRVQIVSGLRPGDRIITTGYQDVTDGQVIKI